MPRLVDRTSLFTACVAGLLTLGLAVAPLPPVAGPAAAQEAPSQVAQAITTAELILLKRMGFDDDAIREEAAKRPPTLSPDDVAALEAAGFSVALIESLVGLAPRPVLVNDDVAQMVAEGKGTVEILNAIADSDTDFDTAPAVMLALAQTANVPPIVLRAMQGRALSLDEVKRLPGDGASEDEIVALVKVVGVEPTELSAAEVLELVHLGVPESVVAALRTRPAAPVAELAETTGDLPQPGYYPHPFGLFTLRYPTDWRLMKEIDEGSVVYAVTPERDVQRLDDLSTGIQVITGKIEAGSVVAGMSASEALAQMLPQFLQAEPGLRPTGEPAKARLGTLDGAMQVLTGTVSGKEGSFRGELYFAVSEGRFVFAAATAPENEFEAMRPTFAQILQRSDFLSAKAKAPPREKLFTAREIVADYRSSVVSVVSTCADGGSTGTGLIVRKDGYVLTNHHVIWDEKEQKPCTSFHIEWDTDLGLPKREAKLIAHRWTVTPIRVNWGVDVALLKLPAARDYEPVHITPSGKIALGDPVVTMGFPDRGRIQTLSTIVTSGVVTRFNKDFLGDTESLFTDAAIAHGSSGGPVFSLVTGGVFGQNTYGWRGIKGYENLWDYSGVLPIDAAMAEYPLVMRLSPEREAMLDAAEAYDLAVQATPRRGTTGLIRLAKVAVEKAPRSADALALLGELQVTYAEDEADRDEGIKTLTRALDLDPKNLRTLILLSSIKAALGEVVEAVRYADQAVDAEPDDWESWLHRAQINHEIGRDTQALDDLKHAEDLSLGVTPEPLLLSGEVNYALKKFEKGREAYRRALEIHPASADAKMGLARYYTLTGDHTSALLEYDKINREYPNNPLILGATARAYEAVEDHKKAVETYQSAIEQWTRHRLLPPEADYLEAAAIALEKLGWKGPAFRLYKQYLANYLGSERSFEAHVATAEILEEDGFKPGAKAHLIQALLLRKDDEGVRKSFKRLGDVLFSLDDIRKLLGPYQYPLTLAATLISVSPLDFAVTKREQVAELLKEFPPNIVVAMIKSTNFYAEAEEKKAAPEKPKRAARPAPTPRPKPAPKPAPEPNAAALVGDWAGPVRDVNFGQQIGSLEIVFYEDGRYEAQMTSYGVAPMYESGTYQISGDTVRMTTDYGQSVDYRFRLEGGTLRLWNPATGEIVLTPA